MIGRKVKVIGNNQRKTIISIFYQGENIKDKNLYMDLYAPCQEEFVNTFKGMVDRNSDELKKEYLRNLEIDVKDNADIIRGNNKFPVIIHCVGLGCPRDYMTFNTEALVNAGYIVVTVGHIYDSMLTIFPEGEVIKADTDDLSWDDKMKIIDKRIEDITAVIDYIYELGSKDSMFKDRVDMDKVGISGHSLGAAAAIGTVCRDSRIKSVIIYDGSIQFMDYLNEKAVKISVPVLNFRRGNFDYGSSMEGFIDFAGKNFSDEKFKKQVMNYHRVLVSSRKNQIHLWDSIEAYKSFIRFKEVNHIAFSDYSILRGIEKESKSFTVKEVHNVINDISVRFFDEFLMGEKGKYSAFVTNNKYISIISKEGFDIRKK